MHNLKLALKKEALEEEALEEEYAVTVNICLTKRMWCNYNHDNNKPN
jgi:hypothetical protein